MGYYAKRGILGFSDPLSAGASDPAATHYIQTKDEYEKQVRELQAAQAAVRKIKDKAEQEIKRAYSDAKNQLKYYQNKADQDAAVKIMKIQRLLDQKNDEWQDLVKALNDCQIRLENQEDLNRNLIRIARERANAQRGISPKKDHDGYIVLSSRQWVDRYERELNQEEYNEKPEEFRKKYKFPCSERVSIDVWKSVLQTPYDASLPLESVRDTIESDLCWELPVLYEIGDVVMDELDGNRTHIPFDNPDLNHLYKWNYQANYKSGYWEMEIYTTGSLVVPEHRSPRQFSKNTSSKHRKNQI